MQIFNITAKQTAKVLVVKTYIAGLTDILSTQNTFIKRGFDKNDILYVSLFDKKMTSIAVGDLRVKMLELSDFLKVQSNINLIIDDCNYVDEKGKVHLNNIFSKVFGKDSSLWSKNGILMGTFDDYSIKCICGLSRLDSIKREMECKKILDTEFEVDLNKINIIRVTDGEKAKAIFKDIYKSDEIFYDIETNSVRWEHIDAKVLTAQLTGGLDKYTSYVFWIDHKDISTTNNLKKVVGQGLKWILESGKKIFIHNANFDLLWTKRHLVPELDFYKVNIYDTMLIYHFLTNTIEENVAVGLKESAFINKVCQDWETDLDVASVEIRKELKLKKEDFNYEMFNPDMLERYAGIDTIVLAHYWDMLKNLRDNHIARAEVDIIEDTWVNNWQPIMQSIQYTIWNGLPFDIKTAKKQQKELEDKIETLYNNVLSDEATEKAVSKLNATNFRKAKEAYLKKCKEAEEKGKSFKGAEPDLAKGNYGSIKFDITFNPSSTAHKQVLFFDVLGIKPVRKTKTGGAVGAEEVTAMYEANPEYKVLSYFNEIAKLEKELGTYVLPFIELSETSFDGFIRGNPVPLNTSLRLRTKSPNILNIPKTDFKKCVAMPNGDFIFQLDYSALENILSLNYTKDEARLAQYKSGIEDAHSVNAIIAGKALEKPEYEPLSVSSVEDVAYVKKTFPSDRQDAKAITFALQYLGSFRSIQFGMNISEDKAKTIYNNYWSTYSGERAFFKKCVKDMNEKGYIKFFGNGVILTPNIENDPDNDDVLKKVRTPFNTTSQSGAFLTLKAMDKAMRRFKEENIQIHTFLSVYDSIIYSGKDKDAIYARKVFLDYMREAYAEDQVVLLKADAEIGYSYKAVRDFEGTDEELEQILKEMRNEKKN